LEIKTGIAKYLGTKYRYDCFEKL